MKLNFEQFSEEHADTQAELLHELARREKERLAAIFPKKLTHYASPRKAKERILRISEQKDIKAYLLEEEKIQGMVARGIGTVITNQWVVHSEKGGPSQVDDLDYWLERAMDNAHDLHRSVAVGLINRAITAQRLNGLDRQHPIIATFRRGTLVHAPGLRNTDFMIEFAPTGRFEMAPGLEDDYGVTHDGAEVETFMVSRHALATSSQ